MHKPRIYIDTSVIGGCFDEEFQTWSNKLFEEFISGLKIAIVSDIVYDELSDSPLYVKNKLDEIPIINLEKLNKNSESVFLADKYVEFKVISEKYYNDAMHIALASLNKVDVLVSWNFKHIVNYSRILRYNSINLMFGYEELEIRNPKEVLTYEEDI